MSRYGAQIKIPVEGILICAPTATAWEAVASGLEDLEHNPCSRNSYSYYFVNSFSSIIIST